VAGLATMPLMRVSARHHFDWIGHQAGADPAWWNRAFRD
jgi:hypothetical protein